MRTLVLGTQNRKKRSELERLFQPCGYRLLTLSDFGDALEVEETGDSFAANARLKASQQAAHLKRYVLGEDSGLVVDALGGAPGVYSARFAGPDATDEQNNDLLLERLVDVPLESRTAHYVCHASVADPEGRIVAESEDCCHGRILNERRGNAGFGYDPLFEIIEYHRTFGELGDTVKTVLSHRARALAQLIPQLIVLIRSGQWPDDGDEKRQEVYRR